MNRRSPLGAFVGIVGAAALVALSMCSPEPRRAHLIPPASIERVVDTTTSTSGATTTIDYGRLAAYVAASRGGPRSPGVHAPPAPTAMARSGGPQGTARAVSATAYCETGTMANGQRTYDGAVASNLWPFGTRLYAVELGRTFTVADHVGHGSDFDIAMPGRCGDAIAFGRRTLHVQVVL